MTYLVCYPLLCHEKSVGQHVAKNVKCTQLYRVPGTCFLSRSHYGKQNIARHIHYFCVREERLTIAFACVAATTLGQLDCPVLHISGESHLFSCYDLGENVSENQHAWFPTRG